MFRKTATLVLSVFGLVMFSACGLGSSGSGAPTVPPPDAQVTTENILAPTPQAILATATITPLPTFSADGGGETDSDDGPATVDPSLATYTPTPTFTPTATLVEPTVLDQINDNPDLSILANLVVVAGLEELLSNPDVTLTVFAPIDSAFDSLPTGMLTAFESDPESTRNILAYHLVAVTADSELLRANVGARTMLNNLEIGLTQEGDDVYVDGAQILTYDIFGSNGVIHIIDSLLLPPEAADQ